MQKSRHIVLSFDGARRESGLGAAAWIQWLREECGTSEKVSYGGRVLMNASAMIADREALRLGIEHLTVLFPTEVSSFDFQVECTDRTVQYKLNAQSLRLFGLHRDVNDAHRAGANRLQNKQQKNSLGRCDDRSIAGVCAFRVIDRGKIEARLPFSCAHVQVERHPEFHLACAYMGRATEDRESWMFGSSKGQWLIARDKELEKVQRCVNVCKLVN